jgi:CxxC motif-containing protein (DUF1111 family)
MKYKYSLIFFSLKGALSLICALYLCPLCAIAQDFTNLGGDLTTENLGRFAIQLPGPYVTDPIRRTLMLEGFGVFHTMRSRKDGLGPFFVNSSCNGCHVQNGKGPASFSSLAERPSAMVVQVSRKGGVGADGSPLPVPGVGNVLRERDLRGNRRYNINLRWRKIKGAYSDGSAYSLRRPQLTFQIRGKNPSKIESSLRMSPAILGTGLVEAIPDTAIEALADPEDSNGDGISGRVNRVPHIRANSKSVGKFGYKSVEPTVEQQSLIAFFNEMGVTNPLFPDPKGRPSEISDLDIQRLDLYQRLAGVPKARDQVSADVQAGRAIFQRIGCEKCHVTTFTTSAPNDPELDAQTIHPFSDFLLHDMGPGLADNRPHFDASGSEWRTTPLWGLGFAVTVSNVKITFLHDGRAQTIEEAILWHGGEGLAARTEFRGLAQSERTQLIMFLRSL